MRRYNSWRSYKRKRPGRRRRVMRFLKLTALCGGVGALLLLADSLIHPAAFFPNLPPAPTVSRPQAAVSAAASQRPMLVSVPRLTLPVMKTTFSEISLQPAPMAPTSVAPTPIAPTSIAPAAPLPSAPLPELPAPGTRLDQDALEKTLWALSASWLESILPVYMVSMEQQVVGYLQLKGERSTSRQVSELEIEHALTRSIEQHQPGLVEHLSVRIAPEGVYISCNVCMSEPPFALKAFVGARVNEERPQLILRSVRLGSHDLSESFLRRVQEDINQQIARQRLLLRVQRLSFGQGRAMLAVELP